VAVEVADFGGGIGEVRLYQNGKLVNGDTTGARTSYKFEVDLGLRPVRNVAHEPF